jgi:DNA-binding transcriptional LysR family regulator
MSNNSSNKLEIPAYKDLTLPQIRSFVAAARLGSLAAAARSQGLAQPTVWKMVRSLEAAFGVRLLEPHARGCRLTDEGRVLEALLRPVVSDLEAVRRRFEEAAAGRPSRLRVAATPRVIEEDLPACVAAFERRRPRAQIVFRTATDEGTVSLVENRECDLGLSEVGEAHPRLAFEPAYALDLLLIAPRGHPLAARRRVGPGDLKAFPMVTAPGTMRDAGVRERLARHDVFRTPARVGVFTTAGIRRYVQLGFGIGLIGGILTPAFRRGLAAQGLAARPMTRYFGRLTVHAVRRADAPPDPAADEFLRTVKVAFAARRSR